VSVFTVIRADHRMTPDIFLFSLGNMKGCFPAATQLVTVYGDRAVEPSKFVARLSMLEGGKKEETNVYLVATELDDIQRIMPTNHFSWVPRELKDDQHIIGVWI
jgi:hypothetical protein